METTRNGVAAHAIASGQTVDLGRGGKYGQLLVDNTKFNERVATHIWDYGLRQILNDAIADKTDDEGNALPVANLITKAEKRLNALYAGELRMRGEAAEPIDPMDAEVYRMAKSKLTELARATPEYAATKGQKDRGLATINARRVARGESEWSWSDAVADYESKVPGVRKAAQRIVKERAAAGDVEV